MLNAQCSMLNGQVVVRVLGPLTLSLVLLCAFSAAGCAKAQASAPTGPPLDVPQPPERVLAPVEEPVTASAPEPETPPPAPVATTPRTPPRPPARRTEPEKPETPAPAAAAAPATPP